MLPPPRQILSFEKSAVIFYLFHCESLWRYEDMESGEWSVESGKCGKERDQGSKSNLVLNLCQVDEVGRVQTKGDNPCMKIDEVPMSSGRSHLKGRMSKKNRTKQIKVERKVVISDILLIMYIFHYLGTYIYLIFTAYVYIKYLIVLHSERWIYSIYVPNEVQHSVPDHVGHRYSPTFKDS